jgi:hypothetical protein
VTRRTDEFTAGRLAPSIRVVGLGRHYAVELRGVTEQNSDGADRQDVLRACITGEELNLVGSSNHRRNPEPLKILRKSGEELGFVTLHSEVASKLSDGRKFRVKLAKVYPYRGHGHGGKQGAVLDFEEVEEIPSEQKPGLSPKWIVVIGIAALLAAAGAAKLLGFL